MALKSKKGYLLIELMISLVLITISGIMLGYLQGNVSRWYRRAMHQLKIAIIADRALHQEIIQDDTITAATETTVPFNNLPFKMMTVRITSNDNLTPQTYQFKGGFFDHQLYKKRHDSH